LLIVCALALLAAAAPPPDGGVRATRFDAALVGRLLEAVPELAARSGAEPGSAAVPPDWRVDVERLRDVILGDAVPLDDIARVAAAHGLDTDSLFEHLPVLLATWRAVTPKPLLAAAGRSIAFENQVLQDPRASPAEKAGARHRLALIDEERRHLKELAQTPEAAVVKPLSAQVAAALDRAVLAFLEAQPPARRHARECTVALDEALAVLGDALVAAGRARLLLGTEPLFARLDRACAEDRVDVETLRGLARGPGGAPPAGDAAVQALERAKALGAEPRPSLHPQ
jgi:hypothetical protein